MRLDCQRLKCLLSAKLERHQRHWREADGSDISDGLLVGGFLQLHRNSDPTARRPSEMKRSLQGDCGRVLFEKQADELVTCIGRRVEQIHQASLEQVNVCVWGKERFEEHDN